MRQRILVVEDDPKLAALIRDYLQQQGYQVTVESRGDRAPGRILAETPDLVVLDLMLPGLDGLAVCRAVREQFPGGILMLTARGGESDEIQGLEVGADDYLAKPVRPRRLLARVQALLRRAPRPSLAASAPRGDGGTPGDADRPPEALRLGELQVDPARREVTLQGVAVDLTTAEFDLLLLLADRAGTVVSRETIYEELRGIPYDGLDRSMDLRVARLRRKLGDDAKQPRLIKSVRGAGYLLVPDP